MEEDRTPTSEIEGLFKEWLERQRKLNKKIDDSFLSEMVAHLTRGIRHNYKEAMEAKELVEKGIIQIRSDFSRKTYSLIIQFLIGVFLTITAVYYKGYVSSSQYILGASVDASLFF